MMSFKRFLDELKEGREPADGKSMVRGDPTDSMVAGVPVDEIGANVTDIPADSYPNIADNIKSAINASVILIEGSSSVLPPDVAKVVESLKGLVK